MRTYCDLVKRIAELHTKYQSPKHSPPHPLIIEKQWIPTVVDSTTSERTEKLPVIVAVGANFATGPGNLPDASDRKCLNGPPWVEQSLSRNRRRAIEFLSACSNGRVRTHWNGLLPYDIDKQYHDSKVGISEPGVHFIMTNLSPCIAREDWSVIRDRSLEQLFTILTDSGMSNGGLWSYFRDLKKCVGKEAVWIGHGNAEVYGLFRLLCWELRIEKWFFDSNLSRPSRMILPS